MTLKSSHEQSNYLTKVNLQRAKFRHELRNLPERICPAFNAFAVRWVTRLRDRLHDDLRRVGTRRRGHALREDLETHGRQEHGSSTKSSCEPTSFQPDNACETIYVLFFPASIPVTKITPTVAPRQWVAAVTSLKFAGMLSASRKTCP